jgi:hypothetical protein
METRVITNLLSQNEQLRRENAALRAARSRVSQGLIAQRVSAYIRRLDETPHCVRVISSEAGVTEDDMRGRFISGKGQAYPFVIGGNAYRELCGQTALEMFKYIGYQTDWAADEWLFSKLAEGTKFWLVVFGQTEQATPATWDGLVALTRKLSPNCAEKLVPHVETMRKMPVDELTSLGKGVDSVPSEVYPSVSSFEDYAASEVDTLEHARAFLRHTLKCTTLYRGDGHAYDDQGIRGSVEVLVPRMTVAELPLPSTGRPSPLFCISDDVADQVDEYRLHARQKKRQRLLAEA